jgi:hypothetical protein
VDTTEITLSGADSSSTPVGSCAFEAAVVQQIAEAAATAKTAEQIQPGPNPHQSREMTEPATAATAAGQASGQGGADRRSPIDTANEMASTASLPGRETSQYPAKSLSATASSAASEAALDYWASSTVLGCQAGSASGDECRLHNAGPLLPVWRQIASVLAPSFHPV